MFEEPFWYMPIPINKDGDGPADPRDTVRVMHEVWDGNCATVCECRDEKSGLWVAQQLSDSALVSTAMPDWCRRSATNDTPEMARVATYDDWFVEYE